MPVPTIASAATISLSNDPGESWAVRIPSEPLFGGSHGSHSHSHSCAEKRTDVSDGDKPRPSVSHSDWRMVLEHSGVRVSEEHLLPWTESQHWTLFLALMICANVLIIGLEVEFNRDHETGDKIWLACEYFFLVFWMAEAASRLYVERSAYVRSPWNNLDMFLIFVTVIEVIIMPLISNTKWAILRVLKILRILRLLRVAKTIKFCRELWLILTGFVEALKTLGWVLLLLLIVVYSGAIIMTVLVGHHCHNDYQFWSDCEDIFGSVIASMFSLFQVITMESWCMLIARPVLKKKGWLFVFFLLFLMLTTFGFLNIIVGVIVENTLRSSNNEQRTVEHNRERQMLEELLEMRELFEEADEDKNGDLNMNEFSGILEKPQVRRKLEKLAIPCSNAVDLFEMLDQDQGGSITIFEFVEGILRLRSQPSASDMRTAVIRVMNTGSHLDSLETNFSEVLETLGAADVWERQVSFNREHQDPNGILRRSSRSSLKSNSSLRPDFSPRAHTPHDASEAIPTTPPQSPLWTLRAPEALIAPPAISPISPPAITPRSTDDRQRDCNFIRARTPPTSSFEHTGAPAVRPRGWSHADSDHSIQCFSPRGGTPQTCNSPHANVTPSVCSRLESVELTVDYRIRKLEVASHNLATSQKQVEEELRKVSEQMSAMLMPNG